MSSQPLQMIFDLQLRDSNTETLDKDGQLYFILCVVAKMFESYTLILQFYGPLGASVFASFISFYLDIDIDLEMLFFG